MPQIVLDVYQNGVKLEQSSDYESVGLALEEMNGVYFASGYSHKHSLTRTAPGYQGRFALRASRSVAAAGRRDRALVRVGEEDVGALPFQGERDRPSGGVLLADAAGVATSTFDA